MERRKNSILAYSIANCFFLSGGIQIMLYSVSKLLGLNMLDGVDHYIFNPNLYLGDQLISFWVIYGLLLIPVLVLAYFKPNSKLLFNLGKDHRLLTYTLLTASLLTLVPFITSLIYYLIAFDPLSLKRLLLFSDGALSIFLKLWIITLPAAIYLKNGKMRKLESD